VMWHAAYSTNPSTWSRSRSDPCVRCMRLTAQVNSQSLDSRVKGSLTLYSSLYPGPGFNGEELVGTTS
jgi:hypothetical protein